MMSVTDPRSLEKEIRRRIKDFEVTALLDLLMSLGYDPREIAFQGHLTEGPQPSVLHDIEFRDKTPMGPSSRSTDEPEVSALRQRVAPDARVTITVNLGLLSCRSPLPSYFRQLFYRLETSDPVLELLRMLDRSLLRVRLTTDTADRLLDDWDGVRRSFVRIHGLDSPLGLRWLFRHVFPELAIRVRRRTDEYRVPYDPARMGAQLGQCVFGNTSRLTVQDIEVALICEDYLHGEEPWLQVADGRIRRFVIPWLDEVCMNLTVRFVLLDRATVARLSRHSYMGYDPMWGLIDEGAEDRLARVSYIDSRPEAPAGEEPPALPPTQVVLFRGRLPQLEPDADALEQLVLMSMAGVDGDVPRLELAPDDTEDARLPPRPGRSQGLSLVRVVGWGLEREVTHAYQVRVRWGCRRWYDEEPFEISVSFEGTPKVGPSPRSQPNLWLWLRDSARTRVANLVVDALSEQESLDPVSDELVARLIDTSDDERLQALIWSDHTPPEQWEPAAWRRLSDLGQPFTEPEQPTKDRPERLGAVGVGRRRLYGPVVMGLSQGRR